MGIPVLSSVTRFNPANMPGCIFYAPLWSPYLQGSTFRSQDKYGHLCTVTGATWGSQGRTFDGNDDNIDCGSGASLDALTVPCTFEAWINPTSLGENNYGQILIKGVITMYMIATARVSFDFTVGAVTKNAASANNTTPLGSWSHVVGVFNGVNVLIYTNLTLVTGSATTGPIDGHSAANLLIGDRSVSDRCFDGLIGEVRIYQRALSAAEIAYNYQATRWRYQ